MTNQAFTSDPLFSMACDVANVKPTKRQASKFRRKTGLAYEQRTVAATLLADQQETEKSKI